MEILRDPNSKYLIIPLITTILGVFAKTISKNDRILKKRWIENLYLAPNLLVSNFVFICCELSKYSLIEPELQPQFNDMCISALLLNIGCSALICMGIRYFGWNEDEKQLRKWRGILLPDLASIGVMYLVFKTLSL